MVNIACSFDLVAAEYSSKIVLRNEDRFFTWKELDLRAGGVASYIRSEGLLPGARLAVCLKNPIDTIIGILGGLKAGCAVTPFNPRLKNEERSQILALLEPSMVLTCIPTDQVNVPAIETGYEDPAIILFTSGSTGIPKGVVLSHRSVKAGLDIWSKSALNLNSNDVVLSVLPLAHSYGLFGTVLAPLQNGSSSILVERFDAEEAVNKIHSSKATIFCGVATMFRRILDLKNINSQMFSSLRFVTSGAAPCPWDLSLSWKKKTGLRIIRGYGMSELFRPICYSPDDDLETPDSIGRAAKGVKLKIVDENGNKVKELQQGELWIKTASCMSEYLNNPDETEAVMKDGWFLTGDIASMRSEGLISIVGRKKEVILRGGYTVGAGEVELVLNSFPDIVESAVIPIPDPDLGEEICAFIVLKGDANCSREKVIEFCKSQMAAYKYPRVIEFVEKLPKSSTGKIIKSELKSSFYRS